MDLMKKKEAETSRDIWIITSGRYAAQAALNGEQGARNGPIMEYRISELARYLLDPRPIEVKKRLIGCQVQFRRPSTGLKGKLEKILPGSRNGGSGDSEVFIVDSDLRAPSLKDPDLQSHLNRIYERLRPYDQTLKRLSSLDRKEMAEVLGLCEDPDGSRSWLNLQGGIDDKMAYIHKHVREEIGVRLEKSRLSEGLFEMRGFDFPSYDARKSYRLMKVFHEGKPQFCVLDSTDEVAFWIEDIDLFRYMQLLQQSISANVKLKGSFEECLDGRARPLKLFFNSQIGVTYSRIHLPETYRAAFAMYHMGLEERNAVVDSLNHRQFGILFNYVPGSHSGEKRLFSSLSVMHDFRALEPVRDCFPQLYSEISKRVLVSEAGSFYLLDSMAGYKDGQ